MKHFSHPLFIRQVIFALPVAAGLMACRQPSAVDAANRSTDADRAPYGVLMSDADVPLAEIVRRIYHDRTENFWFGTNGEGLLMHDGDTLVRFTTNDGLAGNQIRSITEDDQHRIWIATDGGVSVYDRGVFTTIQRAGADVPLTDVWSLKRDSKGTLWAGAADGAYRFDGSRFVPFSLPLPKEPATTFAWQSGTVLSLAEDKQGRMWFGTDGFGAYAWDGQNFAHLSTADGLGDDLITCILPTGDGRIWFSTMFGGVSRYDGKDFTHFNAENGLIGDNEVWTLTEAEGGMVWMCSEGFGAYRFDGQNLLHYGHQEGLGIGAVQSIYAAHSGRVWFGGAGGVYMLDAGKMIPINRNGPWQPKC